MSTFWADFNEVVNGDLIRVSTVLDRTDFFITPDVQAGEAVLLVDGDGNSCFAMTKEVEGEWLTLSLDWQSWSSTLLRDFRQEGSWLATALTESSVVQLRLAGAA